MLALDVGSLVQEILFLLFADLTALIAAVIGPTYDQLFVPEMSTPSLFPAITAQDPGPMNYLAPAAHFSGFLLSNVVDPAISLVALGVAGLYLARSLASRWRTYFDDLLPRLVLSVAAANFSIPIASAILEVAASLFPVVAGWDGGAWQHWVNLGGYGELRLSWDNGVVAFVLSLVEFALVFGLVLAVSVRDALLAALVVLLPLFTLLWPFRPISAIPRRAWLLLGELAFLPSVMVVPLELAVGSPTPAMLVAYLGIALASPFLLSASGTHLMAIGFPSVGSTLHQAAQRGLNEAPGAAASYSKPATGALRASGSGGAAAAAGIRAAGTASAPLAPPLAMGELLGHGMLHLARHVRGGTDRSRGPGSIGPMRPGGSR